MGVADKRSKKGQKKVLGSSWASARCQKNVKKRSPDLFWTFFGPFKAVFMTLNAPKGARREAPRPFGGVFGHQNGFKMSKKCPENVWGHFFDIFLTFCRSPAGPQLDPRTFLFTCFGHFACDPQRPPEINPKNLLEKFSAIPGNPVCSDLAHCNGNCHWQLAL